MSQMWPIKNEKMRNFHERIWFIKYWANYVKRNSDKKWSDGQALLISSQIQSSRSFYKSLKKTEEGRRKIEKILESIKEQNK